MRLKVDERWLEKRVISRCKSCGKVGVEVLEVVGGDELEVGSCWSECMLKECEGEMYVEMVEMREVERKVSEWVVVGSEKWRVVEVIWNEGGSVFVDDIEF